MTTIVLFVLLKALSFYIGIVIMMRLAGKRLAGQTTTIDLIVLITLSVTAQTLAVDPKSKLSMVVFLVTVFATHIAVSRLCSLNPTFRKLIRGSPTTLVKDGTVVTSALRKENLMIDELLAGLRKLGIQNVEDARIAVLEETGHISAVEK